LPIDEEHRTQAINPYGRSKLHIEEMLSDLAASDASWKIACLRYFNPVGAHESGLIGENPNGVPNNLMPYIAQVAAGKRKELSIFGDDYDTPDGTGVRDYIHVMDLAEGHAAALKYLTQAKGCHAINLGTGKGYSVLEMVQTFEKATGREVPYKVVARRAGDVAQCYANPKKAADLLGWTANRSLDDMCESTWRFQHQAHLSVADFGHCRVQVFPNNFCRSLAKRACFNKRHKGYLRLTAQISIWQNPSSSRVKSTDFWQQSNCEKSALILVLHC
jgi:UDP-glucose 4-epimerase